MKPLVSWDCPDLDMQDQMTPDLLSTLGRCSLAEPVPQKKFMSFLKEKTCRKCSSSRASRHATSNQSVTCSARMILENCRITSVIPHVDNLPQDEGDSCEYSSLRQVPRCLVSPGTPKVSLLEVKGPPTSSILTGTKPKENSSSQKVSPRPVLNEVMPRDGKHSMRSSSLRKPGKANRSQKHVTFSNKQTIYNYTTNR